jgi:hypothetical protein
LRDRRCARVPKARLRPPRLRRVRVQLLRTSFLPSGEGDL